jgi:hypothetical protein
MSFCFWNRLNAYLRASVGFKYGYFILIAWPLGGEQAGRGINGKEVQREQRITMPCQKLSGYNFVAKQRLIQI